MSDYVKAGTVIQWVGRLYFADGQNAAPVNYGSADAIARDLNATLYTGGWFSDVQVAASGLVNIDFVVNVTAGTDFAHLSDVVSIIEGAMWNTSYYDWPHLAPQQGIVNVLSVPAGASSASVSQTPSPTGGGGARPVVTPTNTPGSKCPYPESLICSCGQEWSWLHFGCQPIGAQGSSGNVFDGLAKSLGVTPTQAALVGVLGALAIVVAVKRVL